MAYEPELLEPLQTSPLLNLGHFAQWAKANNIRRGCRSGDVRQNRERVAALCEGPELEQCDAVDGVHAQAGDEYGKRLVVAADSWCYAENAGQRKHGAKVVAKNCSLGLKFKPMPCKDGVRRKMTTEIDEHCHYPRHATKHPIGAGQPKWSPDAFWDDMLATYQLSLTAAAHREVVANRPASRLKLGFRAQNKSAQRFGPRAPQPYLPPQPSTNG